MTLFKSRFFGNYLYGDEVTGKYSGFLIQYDWCLYKKKKKEDTETQTHVECHVMETEIGSCEPRMAGSARR